MYARSKLLNTVKVLNTKAFHSGNKVSSAILKSDESVKAVKYFHTSAIALAALFPVALIASPSAISLPFDLALGVIFPLHAHVGLNIVVADYVPKSSRGIARGVVLAMTIITAAGLLKLNIQDGGITESLKSLWRKPQPGAKICKFSKCNSCKTDDCKTDAKK